MRFPPGFGRFALLLVVLFVLGWAAGPACADDDNPEGQVLVSPIVPQLISGKGTDGRKNTVRVGSAGDVSTTLTNPPSELWTSVPFIIGSPSGVSLAVGAGDSSDVIDVSAYRTLGLLIKATPGTGNPGINRLEFQIRTHLNGLADSSSMFVWYPEGLSALGSGTATADTALAFGHILTGSASAPWSGEFTVVANRNRNSPGNSVAATAWSYPNGIYIPIRSLFGGFWGPNLSVRVRNAVGPTCVVSVHLVGTAL